jgi:hypothetical protein
MIRRPGRRDNAPSRWAAPLTKAEPLTVFRKGPAKGYFQTPAGFLACRLEIPRRRHFEKLVCRAFTAAILSHRIL